MNVNEIKISDLGKGSTYGQFIDAVEGKAELTIKPEQALRVMRVMEAAFESDEKKTVINVEI